MFVAGDCQCVCVFFMQDADLLQQFPLSFVHYTQLCVQYCSVLLLASVKIVLFFMYAGWRRTGQTGYNVR